MSAITVGFADGTWKDFTAATPEFYGALTSGGRPVRFVDGSYYNVTYSPTGAILLDGQSPEQIFGGDAIVDDRMIQLFDAQGRQVANIKAADAFAYAPTSTWELYKAYYEGNGFRVERTGTWYDHEVIEDELPGNGDPLPTGTTNTLSSAMPYLLGLGAVYLLFKGSK